MHFGVFVYKREREREILTACGYNTLLTNNLLDYYLVSRTRASSTN